MSGIPIRIAIRVDFTDGSQHEYEVRGPDAAGAADLPAGPMQGFWPEGVVTADVAQRMEHDHKRDEVVSGLRQALWDMVSGFADFLLSCIAEDEAAAREAIAEPGMSANWHETTSGCLDISLPDHGGQDWQDFVWPQGDSRVTRFIAEHDPARVLREVEAKRKILVWHLAECTCTWVDTDGDDLPNEDVTGYGCPTLLMLAAVYSDRPGYRQEWA